MQEDLGTEVNVNGAQESIVAPPSNLADVHMVAVATALKPELKLLYSSALALGVRMKVLGLGAPWRGLASKVELLQEYLSKVADDDLVLFIDAYDVLLLADADKLIHRFLALNARVVFSAEYTCAPDKGLSLLYANVTSTRATPFTYVNSGSYIGYVADVRTMLQEVQDDILTHHTFHGADRFRLDDQRWFNRFFVRHQTSWWANTSKDGTDPVIRSVALDRQGLLFHTLHDVPLDAFKSTSGAVGSLFSTVVRAQPCLIHGNGNGITTFRHLAAKLIDLGWPSTESVTVGELELMQIEIQAIEDFDQAQTRGQRFGSRDDL